MKNDNLFFKKVGFLGLVIVSVFISANFLFSGSSLTPIEPTNEVSSGLIYASDVSVIIDRDDGTQEDLTPGLNPNFFTPDGQNLVMDCLGTGTCAAVTQICVGNGSATNGSLISSIPVTDGGIGGCYISDGLGNATGTFLRVAPNVANGNWSISNTFTATASKEVNATGLLNGSDTGSVFFANNTFTTVTLNNNDQLTIRWNISIA